MPITLHWDVPDQTILRMDIAGQWTWDHLHEARKQIFHMMDASHAERIYTVAHFVDRKLNVPPGMWNHWNVLTDYSHPRAALTVIVGANHFMKMSFGTLKNTFRMTGRPLDFEYADNMEHARKVIARDRARRR